MSDNQDLEPLYKQIQPFSDEYICASTGIKCEIATEHFKDFRSAVSYLAENKVNYAFFTREHNLCVEKDCSVWKSFIQKITENTQTHSL